MLGRFKGIALAITAVLSITTFSSRASAEPLIWSLALGESDRSWSREDCLFGFCSTNWKKEELGGVLLVTADPPDGFDTLHFGVPHGSSALDGVSTNDLVGLRVDGIIFESQAGEFRLNGNEIFLYAEDNGFGLLNFSDTEQNIDFDIEVLESQTWQTNGGLFDVNGAVDVNSSTLTITGPGSTNIDGDVDGNSLSKITKQGNGTLILDGDNSGFTGDIDVTNGRLRLDGGDNISTSTNINLTGDAVLDLNGTGEGVGGLSGSSGTSVDLSSTAALSVGNNGEDTTYAGTIFGNGLFAKDGSGTLTLTGNNTYTGGTRIGGGTLKGDTQALRGDIENNATLEFNNTLGNGIYTGDLSGAGTTRFTGGFRIELRGNNGAATGDMIVTGGTTLRMGSGNAVGNSTVFLNNGELDLDGTAEDIGGLAGSNGQVDLSDNAVLRIGFNNQDTEFNGNIFGDGAFGKQGDGTLTLRGTNTYTGGTTVSGGTLKGDTNSLQGDILNDATLVFDQDSNGTYSGMLSGTGDLVKDGSGTLTISNVNNTYSGGTNTVNGGTLRGNTNSLRGSIINNANLEFNQSFNGTTLGISGTGNVTISGGGLVRFDQTHTYQGTTRVNGSTLRLGSGDALSNGTTVILDNGTLDFDGTGEAFGGLSGDGTVDLSGGAAMSVGHNNANTTFAGAITGNGTVTKAGTGTLTLTGDNSYTGATTVNNGQLRLDNDGDIDQSSSLTVGENGIFNGARNREECTGGFFCFRQPIPGIYGYTYGGTVNNQGILRGGNGVTSGTGTGALTLTGDVSGAGSFEGVVAINGTFRPGNSPALITAETLSFGASNALFMEIGGYGRGSEYDAINATSITLDGLLDIALLDLGNSFSPMSGDTFDLIIADQIFGEFSSFSFAALADGLFWTTQLITSQAGMIYQLVVDGQLVGASVPGPASALILVVGLAGVGVMRRRKA